MTKSKKQQLAKLLGIGFTIWLVFAGIIVFLFYQIQHDPYNTPAEDLLFQSEEIAATYGTVLAITECGIEEDGGNWQIRSYEMATADKKISVLVRIEKDGKKWSAVSYEILGVIDDGTTSEY